MAHQNNTQNQWSRRNVLNLLGTGALAAAIGLPASGAAAAAPGVQIRTAQFGAFTEAQLIDVCRSTAGAIGLPDGWEFRVETSEILQCPDPSRWLVYLEGVDVQAEKFSSNQGVLAVIGGSPAAPDIFLQAKGAPLPAEDLDLIRSLNGEGSD